MRAAAETVDEADLVEEEAFGEDVFHRVGLGSGSRPGALRRARVAPRRKVKRRFFQRGQDRGTDPTLGSNGVKRGMGRGDERAGLAAFRGGRGARLRRAGRRRAVRPVPRREPSGGGRLALSARGEARKPPAALAVGEDAGGWAFVAEAPAVSQSLRPSGRLRGSRGRASRRAGPGASPEMDHLLIAIIEADAATEPSGSVLQTPRRVVPRQRRRGLQLHTTPPSLLRFAHIPPSRAPAAAPGGRCAAPARRSCTWWTHGCRAGDQAQHQEWRHARVPAVPHPGRRRLRRRRRAALQPAGRGVFRSQCAPSMR